MSSYTIPANLLTPESVKELEQLIEAGVQTYFDSGESEVIIPWDADASIAPHPKTDEPWLTLSGGAGASGFGWAVVKVPLAKADCWTLNIEFFPRSEVQTLPPVLASIARPNN